MSAFVGAQLRFSRFSQSSLLAEPFAFKVLAGPAYLVVKDRLVRVPLPVRVFVVCCGVGSVWCHATGALLLSAANRLFGVSWLTWVLDVAVVFGVLLPAKLLANW